MPRFRVLAGPNPDSLQPITHIVNSDSSHPITSDVFEGAVAVYIKGFQPPNGTPNEKGCEYFEREDRKGVTWSIQVRGRFLQPHSADDVLFGNIFDKPLKLPWGSGAALKFMSYVDPTLQHDLVSTPRPWALSPLISTMPHFVHRRLDNGGGESNDDPAASTSSLPVAPSSFGMSSSSGSKIMTGPESKSDSQVPSSCPYAPAEDFPPTESITDDASQLHFALSTSSPSSSDVSSGGSGNASPTSSAASSSSSLASVGSKASVASKVSVLSKASAVKNKVASKLAHKKDKNGKRGELALRNASERRAHFSNAKRRKEVVFGPDDELTLDFCYGYLEFAPALTLRLPGGITFDLMRFWDRHPVRFVCCERGRVGMTAADGGEEGATETAYGRIFWCVSFELADEDDVEAAEAVCEDDAGGVD